MIDTKSDKIHTHQVNTLFGIVEEPDEVDEDVDFAKEDLCRALSPQDHTDAQQVFRFSNISYYHPEIIVKKNIKELLPYINELSLFEQRWGFIGKTVDREEWCQWTEKEAVPLLNNLIKSCEKYQILEPKALYSYFFCSAQDDMLFLYEANRKNIFLTLKMPRLKNGVCFTDQIVKKDSGKTDVIAVVAVNMGKNISETAKRYLSLGRSKDYYYLNGFVLELLDAMTRYVADVVYKQEYCSGDIYDLGYARENYPQIQSSLIRMLDASLIDIRFNKDSRMTPDYSSLALIAPR